MSVTILAQDGAQITLSLLPFFILYLAMDIVKKRCFPEYSCSICLTNRARIRFVPCQHVACCESCAGSLSKCPMCQSPIDATHRMKPKQLERLFQPEAHARATSSKPFDQRSDGRRIYISLAGYTSLIHNLCCLGQLTSAMAFISISDFPRPYLSFEKASLSLCLAVCSTIMVIQSEVITSRDVKPMIGNWYLPKKVFAFVQIFSCAAKLISMVTIAPVAVLNCLLPHYLECACCRFLQ